MNILRQERTNTCVGSLKTTDRLLRLSGEVLAPRGHPLAVLSPSHPSKCLRCWGAESVGVGLSMRLTPPATPSREIYMTTTTTNTSQHSTPSQPSLVNGQRHHQHCHQHGLASHAGGRTVRFLISVSFIFVLSVMSWVSLTLRTFSTTEELADQRMTSSQQVSRLSLSEDVSNQML